MTEKFLYIVLFTFVLYGCIEKRNTISYIDEVTGELIIDTLPYNDIRDYQDIQNMTDPEFLIQEIIKTDCVHERYIGIGGVYSQQYARFERLTELLDDKDFFDLTKHENPNIRLYSLKALALENSDLLKYAKENLARDTALVCTFSGCIQLTISVSELVRIIY